MLTRMFLLLLCCALTAPALPAQSVAIYPFPEVERTPARFSLSPAGARALGLGGAFVAVADDLTAADANPAGLSQLDRPQLLASLRWSSFDTELAGGLAAAGATSDESVAGPAFVGYAHPLGSVTLAGYYQQDARFESGARFGEGVLFSVFSPFIFDHRRYDQTVETVGFAAGARLGSTVSVGGTLRHQRLSVEWLDELDFVTNEPDFAPILGFLRREVDDRDSDLTVALGLLVHPQGRWTGGLSYQQGGDFSLTGTFALSSFGLPVPVERHDLRLALPDVVSGGASFRPRERWLLSAQLSHLTYSDLAGEPVFFIAGGAAIPLFGADEPIDDATQVHLGTEVRLGSGERPVTLRAGLWSDPDHDGIRRIDSDQIHAALGAGTVLGGRWGLDGAVRLSDMVADVVLALSYRL